MIIRIIRIIGIFLLLPAVDDISFNEETLSISDRKKIIRRTLGIESTLCKCKYSIYIHKLRNKLPV